MKRYQASRELETFILASAPRHHACPDAPSTFTALQAASVSDSLPVYDGGCDGTIYSAPAINHAFRAWHDSMHLNLSAQFNATGELDLTLAQCQQVADAGLSREDCAALFFDVWGQFRYSQYHAGEFPVDQSAFVNACFDRGMDAAVRATF